MSTRHREVFRACQDAGVTESSTMWHFIGANECFDLYKTNQEPRVDTVCSLLFQTISSEEEEKWYQVRDDTREAQGEILLSPRIFMGITSETLCFSHS